MSLSRLKPKILVVDDQPVNVKLLQRKLERQDMDIITALSGREAIEVCRAELPDLLLLDVMMPEMDGIEICRHLKAIPETAEIPVIFVTAKTSKEGKLEGLDAGAVDYITKPVDLDEMVARVRTQLRIQDVYRQNLMLQERLSESRQAAAIGAVTQGIAHNLNNLLGVVVGYLDLLKSMSDQPAMVMRSAEQMDVAVTRMANIVRQLSQLTTGRALLRTPHVLSQLLNTTLTLFLDANTQHPELMLDNRCPPETQLHTHAESFETALHHLLQNALESYRMDNPPERPEILVETLVEKQGDRDVLLLTIHDRGVGLPADLEKNVFEPFVTHKTAIGTGMGLTIARHNLRNLGGDVQIHPRAGGGTSVVVGLPLKP